MRGDDDDKDDIKHFVVTSFENFNERT